MAQCYLRPVPLRVECDSDDGFDTLGCFRHPSVFKSVFNLARAFDRNEPAVVRPRSPSVLHGEVEKARHRRVRIKRSAPNHGTPGLLGLIQTSNTSSFHAADNGQALER